MYTIDSDLKLTNAVAVLNKIKDLSRLTLFVKNKKNKVIGSLTDGDVRRAIEKYNLIDIKLNEICNKNFKYLNHGYDYVNLEKFRKDNIYIVPVLNKKKELVEILDLNKIKSILPIDCFIMAGGRGKRLSPLTDTTPKPMLNLGNKPIIEHNIDRLISFGVRNIYISVNYLSEQIKNHFGDGSQKGIKIQYIDETKPLGTAGSLSLLKKSDSENVLLLNSDLLTNIDFEKMFLSLINTKSDMVIASFDYKIDIPYAVFTTKNNKILSFKEKPSYNFFSNAGIYIFKKKFIKLIPKNKFYDITDLMEKMITKKFKLIFYPIKGYWIDIGTPSDYERAKSFVKNIE